MSYFGQVGGLPDTVDTTESDHVGSAMALGIHDIAEDIHAALGLQDLHESLLQGLLHRRGHRWEGGRWKENLSRLGNAPEPQTTSGRPHGHLLVNVPITFPSSFLATDSQSCTAISAATFFASRKRRGEGS